MNTPLFKTQMNLMSPNDSRLISNNPKIMNTPSTVNIIKEFRNVFQEAENTLKVNNGNNQSESFFYQMPQRESNLNESNFTNTNVAAVTGNNNNVDSLKISNEILNKSNLDLKNLNKLLKIELSSYKNSIGSTGNIPLTQYDTNISIYIDTLKTALNTAQMSGRELNEIYNQVKEQNDKIVEENENLKNQVMQFSKENEETSSTKKDYETLNTNLLQKCNELSNENMQIQKQQNAHGHSTVFISSDALLTWFLSVVEKLFGILMILIQSRLFQLCNPSVSKPEPTGKQVQIAHTFR